MAIGIKISLNEGLYLRDPQETPLGQGIIKHSILLIDEIGFEDSLGVSKNSTFFNGQLRWKFGSAKKWSVFAQYFSNDATGDTVLTEDVEWDGMTWKEGSFVDAGVKLSVARL